MNRFYQGPLWEKCDISYSMPLIRNFAFEKPVIKELMRYATGTIPDFWHLTPSLIPLPLQVALLIFRQMPLSLAGALAISSALLLLLLL